MSTKEKLIKARVGMLALAEELKNIGLACKRALHDSVRFVIRKMPVFNRLIVWIDDILGYGKPVQTKHFWETS